MSTEKNVTRIHDEIDENLRIAYQQILNEKLPQRFVDLLDLLRAGDKDTGSRGQG